MLASVRDWGKMGAEGECPGTAPKTNVQWFGADADVGISRSWYLILSAMRTTGGIESNDQAYAGLSYRF